MQSKAGRSCTRPGVGELDTANERPVADKLDPTERDPAQVQPNCVPRPFAGADLGSITRRPETLSWSAWRGCWRPIPCTRTRCQPARGRMQEKLSAGPAITRATRCTQSNRAHLLDLLLPLSVPLEGPAQRHALLLRGLFRIVALHLTLAPVDLKEGGRERDLWVCGLARPRKLL